MAEIKTKPTTASVADFISSLPDEQQRADSRTLLDLMQKATGEEPKMWGASLIGFGQVRLKSPTSGREVDWLRVGFAPRKTALSVYLSGDIQHQHGEALTRLGKHKTGLGCLYIKRLTDVDLNVLAEMIAASLAMDFFAR